MRGNRHGRKTTPSASSVPATKLNARALNVTPERVDPHALDVIRGLRDAGFRALLVGGCVRDLLLGAAPKDFDVVTEATPEQVRGLFRRSRLVGRRFKIAHVYFGRELVEVSTFRKSLAANEKGDHAAHPTGLILRDNAYGTLHEDAFRRDFTANALYYDPHSDEILDFVGGFEDLKRHQLRFIGNARERLREDPVRLLRALRFMAKLGFDLDDAITRDDQWTAERLTAIPPARLFEEFIKLFLTGYADNAWQAIQASPVRRVLFPTVPPNSPLIRLAMRNTDHRIAEEKSVTPAFLFAVMLWEDYCSRTNELATSGGASQSPREAALAAAHETIAQQRLTVAIPRRHVSFVHDIWDLQAPLQNRPARSIGKTLNHYRFRAAFDLLLLRAEVGDVAGELAAWWEDIQGADKARRDVMVNSLGDPPSTSGRRRKRRGRRRKRKSKPSPV